MDADQLDLKITGHVVTPDRVLEDGWIGVRGEIVAGLGPAAPAARQVIDACGPWVLPGVVDAHVHCFSEPAEGFTHATRGGLAAVGELAAGGGCGFKASMFETDPSRFPRIGMLFAPSRDGRSHCPEKWTEPDDIAVCLTAAVIRLDEELTPGPWP
jgi:hypothetical protein